MKRFLCLIFFTLLLYSCKETVDYEKRMQEFKSNHKVLSMSRPATDTNHFVIWMEDGKVMYSELDDAEPTILLSPGDTMHLSFQNDFAGIISHCNVVFNPESFEIVEIIYNIKQFVLANLEADKCYNYCLLPVDKSGEGLGLDDIYVEYDEYLGKSIISTRVYQDFFNLIDYDGYDGVDIDEVWGYYSEGFFYDWTEREKLFMKAAATIKEDMSIEVGDSFYFCGKSYQRSSLDNPETIDELYTSARRYWFEQIAIPEWIKRAVRYEVLDNEFSNKIRAEQDVQRGKSYCFKETFESVDYSDNPQYKYRLFSREYRHTNFYLYTNEPIVAELSYPKFIYFLGTFVRHSSEGYPDGILTDGIVLAYADDSNASYTKVVSHLFDEDYKGPHSRMITYPDDIPAECDEQPDIY